MRCPDKVTALHPLTHCIVFANAPHCVFSLTLQEWRTTYIKVVRHPRVVMLYLLLHASLIADEQGSVGACLSDGVEEGTV